MDPLDSKSIAEDAVKRHNSDKRLMSAIAVFTSLFALLAASSSLMSSRCSTRGLVAKNEAIYFQGLSTDEWAFFQSRNIRMDLALLAKAQKQANLETAKNFQAEADESFKKAKDFEVKRDNWNTLSKKYLDVSKTFGAALSFLQVSIILVPLTLIAEVALIFIFGDILGLIGIYYLAIAFIDYYDIIKNTL